MGTIMYVFYLILIATIRVYKFLELQILKIFVPILQLKATEITNKLGVVLHFGQEIEGSQKAVENFTEDERQRGLTTYDKILHFRVHNTNWLARISNKGLLAAAETYVEKMWDYIHDVEDLSEFATRALENNLSDLYFNNWNRILQWAEYDAFNVQNVEKPAILGKTALHNELGVDFFEIMLDPWLQFSCAYFKDANNLVDAQLQKMELIAQKLELKPGLRVLDIGCGYGNFCKYLTENYHVQCIGITVEEKHVTYAQQNLTGLAIEIRLQDYRQLANSEEKFDRIVSIEMLEYVGHKNYRQFFKVVNHCLQDDGLFLLQTIGRNHTKMQKSNFWSSKYVFPYGSILSPGDIARGTKDLFVIEDWHNFGMDYARTLYFWRENFIAGWPKLEGRRGYGGDSFYRRWIIYLSLAQALFQSRKCQVWQLALSKEGLKREYRAAR